MHNTVSIVSHNVVRHLYLIISYLQFIILHRVFEFLDDEMYYKKRRGATEKTESEGRLELLISRIGEKVNTCAFSIYSFSSKCVS